MSDRKSLLGRKQRVKRTHQLTPNDNYLSVEFTKSGNLLGIISIGIGMLTSSLSAHEVFNQNNYLFIPFVIAGIAMSAYSMYRIDTAHDTRILKDGDIKTVPEGTFYLAKNVQAIEVFKKKHHKCEIETVEVNIRLSEELRVNLLNNPEDELTEQEIKQLAYFTNSSVEYRTERY